MILFIMFLVFIFLLTLFSAILSLKEYYSDKDVHTEPTKKNKCHQETIFYLFLSVVYEYLLEKERKMEVVDVEYTDISDQKYLPEGKK